jgi:hypothetical protein
MRKWGLCMYAMLVSYIEVLRGSDEEAHKDESQGTIREKAGPLHLHSGVRSSSGKGDAWLAKTRSKKKRKEQRNVERDAAGREKGETARRCTGTGGSGRLRIKQREYEGEWRVYMDGYSSVSLVLPLGLTPVLYSQALFILVEAPCLRGETSRYASTL